MWRLRACRRVQALSGRAVCCAAVFSLALAHRFRSVALLVALLCAGVSAGPHLVSATQASVAVVQVFDFDVGGVARVNASSYDRLTMAVAVCRSLADERSWNIMQCFQVRAEADATTTATQFDICD